MRIFYSKNCYRIEVKMLKNVLLIVHDLPILKDSDFL